MAQSLFSLALVACVVVIVMPLVVVMAQCILSLSLACRLRVQWLCLRVLTGCLRFPIDWTALID
jgi:hypothetical protein